jgi:hypothetical protein
MAIHSGIVQWPLNLWASWMYFCTAKLKLTFSVLVKSTLPHSNQYTEIFWIQFNDCSIISLIIIVDSVKNNAQSSKLKPQQQYGLSTKDRVPAGWAWIVKISHLRHCLPCVMAIESGDVLLGRLPPWSMTWMKGCHFWDHCVTNMNFQIK